MDHPSAEIGELPLGVSKSCTFITRTGFGLRKNWQFTEMIIQLQMERLFVIIFM
jgi:hypothetical protein